MTEDLEEVKDHLFCCNVVKKLILQQHITNKILNNPFVNSTLIIREEAKITYILGCWFFKNFKENSIKYNEKLILNPY